ncbi:YtxH domain-containing protein [Flavobacteriaceae bacterium SZ-1-7]|uniref:YtxH domain-containing protein n=1 Tax=Tamlana sedimenti TaxID=3134126 RepID=UPI003125233F
MSDEKNLSDDLNDMLGDAKDSAKKAADKASEKTKEFAKDAKEAASEFADDAKEVLSDGKNVAIIAHIHLIGWVIALIMNSSNKTEMGSFYIRQMLGLILLSFLGVIPVLGWILLLVIFVAWIMSLVSALGGKMKPTFLLGAQFQDWFKSL